MASRAVNGLGRPPFTTAITIYTEIDTQLHVSGPRCRNDPVITEQYGDHGQTMGRPWAQPHNPLSDLQKNR